MVAISVIVPVHNGEKYLHKCLDSILNGTFRDLEVIVVENASTDSTLAICRDYEARDENVRVLTTDIPGLSHARNMGMEAAKGIYLAFADADDYVSPYIYEHLYACAQEQGSDFVYCDHIKDYERDYHFQKCHGQVETDDVSDYYYQMYLGGNQNLCFAWNKLMLRTRFENIRFDEELRNSEDVNWTLRCVCVAEKICHLKEPLYYYYRGNEQSISNSTDQRIKMHAVYSNQKDLAFLDSQYPDRKLWQECVAACLLQYADVRRQKARELGLEDIENELKPIIRTTAKRVRKAKYLKKKDKLRVLAQNDCPKLFAFFTKLMR